MRDRGAIIEDILNRMEQMERASARNPNLMQTYQVMWEALKKELTKPNKDFYYCNCYVKHDFLENEMTIVICNECKKRGLMNGEKVDEE